MSVTVKVLGVQQVTQFLNKKEKRISDKSIPKGLRRASIFLQGEVKQSIAGRKAEPRSVDTGRFLSSVGIALKGKKEAVVFSKIPYAKALEFGTSKRGARKHFRNSKDRNKQNIRRIFEATIKGI